MPLFGDKKTNVHYKRVGVFATVFVVGMFKIT
jgi:hypothetical protein